MKRGAEDENVEDEEQQGPSDAGRAPTSGPDPTGPGLQQEILTCAEAMSYAVQNPDAPGMMVINIEDVILDGPWKTKCTVNASCGGTSTSTSKFDGGNIGGFSDEYYPEIKEAN